MKYFSWTKSRDTSESQTWYGIYNESGFITFLFSLDDEDENFITITPQNMIYTEQIRIDIEADGIYLSSTLVRDGRGITKEITEKEFLLAMGFI